MSALTIKSVPKLEVSKKIHPASKFDAKKTYKFHYEVSGHNELPHVVKFSGGRSSAMMLFILLEAKILKPERGDVVVFNNTSAEHPETYKFTERCKEVVEKKYNIPFFWIEYQTYEDSRNGEWAKSPSYRLVQTQQRSKECLNGYQWRGETFEELLSFTGFVPNQFQRTCTVNLKLETTRAFLKDWFACKPTIERLGHFGENSRIDSGQSYERHLKNNGSVPKDIFLNKKSFVHSRPISRPSQDFADFSSAYVPFQNKHLEGKSFGNTAYFGKDGIEYLAFVGLRFDEMRRVVKVRRRNFNGPETVGYEGEHVYMPLSDMGITREDAEKFWEKQSWNLLLDAKDGLSNCTYCFLKGARGLKRVRAALGDKTCQDLKGSPCDINWWVNIEKKYGRDLKAENREIRSDVANNFIGFFGTQSGFSYQQIANSNGESDFKDYEETVLPCDCTE